MYKEEFRTRQEAVQRELFFKTGMDKEWIKKLVRAVADSDRLILPLFAENLRT